MDETEEDPTYRQVYKVDGNTIVTTLEADLECMTIYKAHINDAGMHFTGYGSTRAEAAIVALNKCAG